VAERICPLCEKEMAEEVCPEDGVPTIESSVFDVPEEAIKPGMLLAERYKIIRLAGRGAMGSVFEATQLSMDRRVAVKTLQKAFVSDQKLVKRFYLEARAASRLDHPNIVRIFDFGIDDGTKVPFIAMEFLEGGDLGDTLELTGAMPETEACRLLSQVAKALVAAHGKGIVHRDLKPDNIHMGTLADGDMHAKVLDFGIAKVLHGGSDSLKSLTGTGMTMGTPLYMSPEQIRGEKVDFRCDLYALGCILHELVTGVRPYTSEERMGIFMQHISGEMPRLPEVLVNQEPPSDGLLAIHHALLQKNRENRPTTTVVVAKILGALARGDHVNAAELLAAEPGTGSAPMATDPNQKTTIPGGTAAAGTDATMAAPAMGTSPLAGMAADALSEDGLDTLGHGASSHTGGSSTGSRVGILAVAALVLGGAAFALFPGLTEGTLSESAGKKAASQSTQTAEEPPSDAADNRATSAVQVVPTPAPPAKPVLPLAVVRVETTPPGATIRDGKVGLGKSPAEVMIPEGVAGRTLSIEMEGYKPRAVLATRDTASPLVVALEALPKAKPVVASPPRKRSQRAKRSPARARAAAPRAPPAAKPKKKPKDVPIW
jgi:tRNA A-37 threonylcarbamoyl transferase component Bud32